MIIPPYIIGYYMTDIAALQAKADKALAELAEAKLAVKAGAIERIKKEIAQLDITQEELGFAVKISRTRKKPEPKYQDSKGNTWSGRGRVPAFLKGKDLDKYLIKK